MLLVNMVFADIPLDKNGNNKTAISDLNYLPWILGVLFAIQILHLDTLKKRKK